MRPLLTLALIFSCCAGGALGAQPGGPAGASAAEMPRQATKSARPALDRSGKPRQGKASYYGREFAGKKMADGTPMNPNSNVAASKTLPLGTRARVTNLRNGKSAEVEIKDRGPYVAGRIVDVSPKVADKLDIDKEGVAPVEVKPVDIPPKENATSAPDAPRRSR